MTGTQTDRQIRKLDRRMLMQLHWVCPCLRPRECRTACPLLECWQCSVSLALPDITHLALDTTLATYTQKMDCDVMDKDYSKTFVSRLISMHCRNEAKR